MTVAVSGDGEGKLAAALEIPHVVFLFDDSLLEEPAKVEDHVKRRRVEIDVSLRLETPRATYGDDRANVGIQGLSLRHLLFRDEAEEGEEHAMREDGGRMALHEFHERDEHLIDVLRETLVQDAPRDRARTGRDRGATAMESPWRTGAETRTAR